LHHTLIVYKFKPTHSYISHSMYVVCMYVFLLLYSQYPHLNWCLFLYFWL